MTEVWMCVGFFGLGLGCGIVATVLWAMAQEPME